MEKVWPKLVRIISKYHCCNRIDNFSLIGFLRYVQMVKQGWEDVEVVNLVRLRFIHILYT